jgi:hypothetical protein
MTISTPTLFGSAAGTSSGTTASNTPSANSTLLAWCFCRHASAFQTINTPTDGLGGTWDAVGGNFDGPASNAFVRGRLYKQRIGGSPAAMTVSGSSTTGASFGMLVVEVVSDALDFGVAVAEAPNGAGDPSPSISGTPAAVLSFVACQASNGMTPPTGHTELASSDLTFNTNMRAACSYDLSSPSTTCNWTSTNVNSVAVGFELKEASANKTLAADAVSFAFIGQTASLEHGWEIAADAVSFSFTGQAATFVRSHRLTAAAGSFSFNGEAASLEHGRKLVAEAAAFAFAGQAADLVYTPAGAIVLSADAVSFAFTGSAAALELGREVLGAAASYTFTGQAASLVHGWKLAAAAGSFAFNGETASLEIGRKLAAAAASYAFTGQAASLAHGWEIAAEAAAFTFTGQDATLVHEAGSIVLSAEAAAFAFTGSAATLIHSGATMRRRTGIRARGLQGDVSRAALQGVALRSNVQRAGTRRS